MGNDDHLRKQLEAARRGDRESVAELDALVRGIARRLVDSRTESILRGVEWQDVAQEALVRLVHGEAEYAGTGSARGYVYRTVKTALLQTIRGVKRRTARNEAYSESVEVPEDDRLVAKRASEEILAAMSDECRELVERALLFGVSFAELAKEAGMAESSIRSRLSRCLRRAREREL